MNFDDPSSSSGSALESATLKPPGQLEQWSAAMQALTTVATFKGAKVDQSKPLTPNFVVRHAVQLGCEARDPAESAQYSFMGQVFNDTGVLMSTLDWNGTHLKRKSHPPYIAWLCSASLSAITVAKALFALGRCHFYSYKSTLGLCSLP